MAIRTIRSRSHGQSAGVVEVGSHDRRVIGCIGKQDRHRSHPQRRSRRSHDLSALRRAPTQRFALHAAIAYRAHRPHHIRTHPQTTLRPRIPSADSLFANQRGQETLHTRRTGCSHSFVGKGDRECAESARSRHAPPIAALGFEGL